MISGVVKVQKNVPVSCQARAQGLEYIVLEVKLYYQQKYRSWQETAKSSVTGRNGRFAARAQVGHWELRRRLPRLHDCPWKLVPKVGQGRTTSPMWRLLFELLLFD